MARRSDPLSSHAAADAMVSSGRLARNQKRALLLVRLHPHRNAKELAGLAEPDDALAAHKLEIDLRKRLPELRDQGLLVSFDRRGGQVWVSEPWA